MPIGRYAVYLVYARRIHIYKTEKNHPDVVITVRPLAVGP